MRIGMTYDLRDDYLAQGFSDEEAGEFDAAVTIDAIEAAIRHHGHTVERIGSITALVGALAAGKRWDLVFNIAEGVSGIAREAQVPALLEAYGIPFTFSTADVLTIAMDKAVAKLIVRQAGVSTPDFAVVRDVADIAAIDLPYPLFVKPLAEGTSKGVQETSRVTTPRALEAKCRELLSQYRQPALVETFLPGREFTIGLLGAGATARVIGVAEVTFKPGGDATAYSYRNKMDAFDELTLVNDPLAEDLRRADVRCELKLVS